MSVLSVDKSKLLSEANWSTGITIQKWRFRPKETNQQEALGEGIVSETSSSNKTESSSTNTKDSGRGDELAGVRGGKVEEWSKS